MTSQSPSTVADVIVELHARSTVPDSRPRLSAQLPANARIKRVVRVSQSVTHYNNITNVKFASSPYICLIQCINFLIFNNVYSDNA